MSSKPRRTRGHPEVKKAWVKLDCLKSRSWEGPSNLMTYVGIGHHSIPWKKVHRFHDTESMESLALKQEKKRSNGCPKLSQSRLIEKLHCSLRKEISMRKESHKGTGNSTSSH